MLNRFFCTFLLVIMALLSPVIVAAQRDSVGLAKGVVLNEITVRRTKEKYSKKNNPAVDFVKRVMAQKYAHRATDHPYYSNEKYQKVVGGLTGFPAEDDQNWMLRTFKFMREFVDTNEMTGQRMLPLFVKEQISANYYSLDPKKHKELVSGVRNEGIDQAFDQESMLRFFDDVFRDIDIFSNDIPFMQSRFVSPLSNIGTSYYKYYLNDTIMLDGEPCVDLSFAPFNSESWGFTGRIFVSLNDSTMFVKRVVLGTPSTINVNFLKKMFIVQDYERMPDGTRIKTRDEMLAEFEIIAGTQRMFAHRLLLFRNHNFEKPEDMSVFEHVGERVESEDAHRMPREFWDENRFVAISNNENAVGKILERLRKNKLFYYTEKVVHILVSGYIPTAGDDKSKFDIGVVNTFFSGNPMEGFRLKVGGMTTANLSKHFFARGYVAYGFRDEKFKYMGQLEYSFNKKKRHSLEFPVNSLRLMHEYNVDKLGQHYLYTNPDNIFLALKRKSDDKMTYLRRSELEYKLETRGGFSFALNVRNDIQEASRFIPFVDGHGETFTRFSETGVNLTLRFAPGEKFYESKKERIPINLDAPIFTLTHSYCPKGLFGNKYEINKTEIGIMKRFWLSAFGYADIIVRGGKIWSQVPFTHLMFPNANLSFTIQPESYALMNAMEFATDQYASWDLTYWANGAILNRIPFVKYLNLREVFSFRGMWGRLSDKNNPLHNKDLLRFPETALCMPMGNTPYMEVGVGLDNIFSIFRVDYIWRITYRNNPDINRGGVRIQLHLTF